MDNRARILRKNITPAWHIGVEAFLALLLILIIPLSINVWSLAKSVLKSDSNEPQKEIVKETPKNKTTLTKFLAAAVFGVGEENVVMNEETGEETIILPYGGEINNGGDLARSGNIYSNAWSDGTRPHSDGTVNEIRKPGVLDTGGFIGSGSSNTGGLIPAGGSIN